MCIVDVLGWNICGAQQMRLWLILIIRWYSNNERFNQEVCNFYLFHIKMIPLIVFGTKRMMQVQLSSKFHLHFKAGLNFLISCFWRRYHLRTCTKWICCLMIYSRSAASKLVFFINNKGEAHLLASCFASSIFKLLFRRKFLQNQKFWMSRLSWRQWFWTSPPLLNYTKGLLPFYMPSRLSEI